MRLLSVSIRHLQRMLPTELRMAVRVDDQLCPLTIAVTGKLRLPASCMITPSQSERKAQVNCEFGPSVVETVYISIRCCIGFV